MAHRTLPYSIWYPHCSCMYTKPAFLIPLFFLQRWDTDLCDVELLVEEPNVGTCSPFNNHTRIGGIMGRSFTSGYGPNEYFLATAPSVEFWIFVFGWQLKGVYQIKARLFHASGPLDEGVTLSCTIMTNFGHRVITVVDNTQGESSWNTTQFITTPRSEISLATITKK